MTSLGCGPPRASLSGTPRPGQSTQEAQPAGRPESEPSLPDPKLGAFDVNDALSALFVLESRDRDLSLDEGGKKLQALQRERHEALAQELQAIAREDEAAKRHDFWHDLGSVLGEVAKVAGLVASVAAAVCSAGAAAPIAAIAIGGVVLSAASFADREFHLLRQLGVDETSAAWVDLGLSLGAAASSLGASVAAGGQLGVSVGTVFARAATVVSGVTAMGQGATTIEAGQALARIDEAAAEEASAQARSGHAARVLQLLIDETRRSDENSRRLVTTITTTKGLVHSTLLTAATALKG